jgi:organic hydroperoxide reductase OsmC/OhrA
MWYSHTAEVDMPTKHLFHARLSWKKPPDGAGTHRVEFENRPPLEVAAAPQYKGDPTKLNPEELFVASLVSCQMLTYLALAARAGVLVSAYEDRAEATLTMAERRMRITEVVLHPRITIAAAADEDKARALVDAAHDGCFIANSVTCTVRAEPEIVREP